MHKSLTTIAAFGLGACSTAAITSSAAAPQSAVAPETTATATADAHAGYVRAPAQIEHRTAPNGTASIALLAQGDAAFVGLLEMDAGGAVPEHQDATEEYIYVLDGGGSLTIDGVSSTLEPGSIVYMPANATVSYVNGPQPLRALQVFAGPAPAAKYDAWSPAE